MSLANGAVLDSSSVQAPPDHVREFPLSFAQQRLWFLAQIEGVSEAYHIPLGLHLKGNLNRIALRRALDRILARHEALRTTFSHVDGEPVQRISAAEGSRFPLIEHDLRHDNNRDAEIERIAGLETSESFDLGTGPLIRGRLIQLSDDEHILLITVHHIVSDGWSMDLLIKEISVLYGAFVRGGNDPLQPLETQYADYSVWHRQWVQGDILKQQATYWKTALAGAPALLELPADHPRPLEQNYSGAMAGVLLDEELTNRLKEFSRGHRITPFITLLAAWAALLARLSGQPDVLIGVPTANRPRAEIENLIGFFANTVVVRLDLTGSLSVRELLSQVRTRSLAAQQYQDIPFEQVVELARPTRSMAHSPLFQVMFAWQGTAEEKFELPELSVQHLTLPHRVSKFDLSLELRESGNTITGGLEYATSLFEKATIERYLGYYRNLLEAMMADDAMAIGRLPILPADERRHLLVELNDTRAEFPSDKCIHQMFEEQVLKTPDATAVVFEDASISYAELNRSANRLAHYLRELGVKPDARVAVCVERSFEMVVALMAIVKAGGAYVPLDPSYPVERLRYMVEDSEPVALLIQRQLEHLFEGIGGHFPIFDLTAPNPVWQDQPETNPDPDAIGLNPLSLAYVIYTSGSTGNPKGVLVHHRGVVNRMAWMQFAYDLQPSEAVLQKTPFGFDVSVWEFFWTLQTGARLVMARPEGHKDPGYLVETIRKNQITTMHFVPSMLQVFLEHEDLSNMPSLVRVVCSGEALPAALLQRFQERIPHAKLHNLYGPTEAAVDVTAWTAPNDFKGSIVPIGKPVWNTSMYVLDAHMEPVPMGVTGELYIGGVQVARGYLNRPELTAERFVADVCSSEPGARMYRTGDLARFLPDGNIEYLGRNDFQVKIRGFRIELGEIEARLTEHPAVREAVVIAREDTAGDKRLVAYYTPSQLGEIEADAAGAEQFRAHLSTSLPDYMVPAAYVRMEAFPLSANGKLDRKALPAPVVDAYSSHGYEAPQGDIETKLASFWTEVLKIDQIGRHDNFFDLGGHSLMAVRALALTNREFGTSLPIRVLFQANTISQLASVIGKQSEAQSEDWSTLIPIQTLGTRTPLFCVARPNVNALGYAILSRELGNNQPIYGLQVRLDEDPNIDFTEEQYQSTAAEYVRTIRTVQPHGPYNLIGQCQGAYIAFRMVQQLEAEGEKVAFLGILDAWIEENTRYRWRFETFLAIRLLRTLGGRISARAHNLIRPRPLSRETVDHPAQSQQAGSTHSRKALFQKYFPGKDFVPPVCSAPITVFRLDDQPWYRKNDVTMGWAARTRSGVTTRNIGGHHLTILRQPHVQELATMLTEDLDEAALKIRSTGAKETIKTELS